MTPRLVIKVGEYVVARVPLGEPGEPRKLGRVVTQARRLWPSERIEAVALLAAPGLRGYVLGRGWLGSGWAREMYREARRVARALHVEEV